MVPWFLPLLWCNLTSVQSFMNKTKVIFSYMNLDQRLFNLLLSCPCQELSVSAVKLKTGGGSYQEVTGQKDLLWRMGEGTVERKKNTLKIIAVFNLRALCCLSWPHPRAAQGQPAVRVIKSWGCKWPLGLLDEVTLEAKPTRWKKKERKCQKRMTKWIGFSAAAVTWSGSQSLTDSSLTSWRSSEPAANIHILVFSIFCFFCNIVSARLFTRVSVTEQPRPHPGARPVIVAPDNHFVHPNSPPVWLILQRVKAAVSAAFFKLHICEVIDQSSGELGSWSPHMCVRTFVRCVCAYVCVYEDDFSSLLRSPVKNWR